MMVRFVKNAEVPNVGEWGAGDVDDVPTEVGYSLIASGHAVQANENTVIAEAESNDVLVSDGVGIEITRADEDDEEED